MKTEFDFEKKPMSKKKRIIIFISICVVIILIASFIGIKNYLQKYNDHILMAEYYYEQANYDQAYKEVEHLFPIGNNQEFVDKLKLMKDSYSFLPTEEKLKNPSSEYQSTILMDLLIGLSSLQVNKEKFKSLNLSNHFENIRSKYLSILASQFAVNESIAKELLNASSNEREARITRFGEMAASKINKETIENYVPESSSNTDNTQHVYTKEQLENDPLAPSTNPNDYDANGQYVPENGVSNNPADYNSQGEYRPIDSMTPEETQKELEDILGESLGNN